MTQLEPRPSGNGRAYSPYILCNERYSTIIAEMKKIKEHPWWDAKITKINAKLKL